MHRLCEGKTVPLSHKMQTCYLKSDPALIRNLNLRNKMRDMTPKFKRDLNVSNKRKLLI